MILEKINRRLHSILESTSANFIDPSSPSYDRQYAEDLLWHTVGPLTETPHFIDKWSSPSEPPPDFTPNGPAPKWTPDELVIAFAGDPSLLFRAGGKDHPRAPAYGNRGGAPLYRLAMGMARKYNRAKDKAFIEDMYSNGFVELTKLMKPGYDESRSPFISYVFKTVEGAMEHGTSGSTEQAIKARGDVSQGKNAGLIGIQGLLKARTPEEAMKVADQVKGKYTAGKHHDKHQDNPFGPFSMKIYQLATAYANALSTGDEAGQNRIRGQIEDLDKEIVDSQEMIPGASTGIGQAVSSSDRKTPVGVSSIDVSSDEGGGTFADTIANRESDGMYGDVDPEEIQIVLGHALKFDVGATLGNIPRFQQMALEFGLKPEDKIGGKFTANEYRWLLRSLGALVEDYPGKGVMRSAIKTPRDKTGWWQPGEDPEMEPIPSGGIWHSIWTRGDPAKGTSGYQSMGGTEISQEMTKEAMEFYKLGIPTVREVKAKATGVSEVVSKVAVGNTLKSAGIKLKLIAAAERMRHESSKSADPTAGVDESIIKQLPLLESLDKVDYTILIEAFDKVIARLDRIIREDAPPGWSGTVDHMKNDGMSDDKAFSIVWSSYKKGNKSHKKPTKEGDKYVSPSEWRKHRKS